MPLWRSTGKPGDRVAEKRQRRTGKIQGPAIEGRHHFHHVGIPDRRIGGIERIGGGRHIQRWIARHGCGELVDERGINQRFIALDVHNVGGLRGGKQGLGNAVGPGRVIGRGHHGLAAESADSLQDPLIVGGDEDFIEAGTLSAALPNVLDQRLSRR